MKIIIIEHFIKKIKINNNKNECNIQFQNDNEIMNNDQVTVQGYTDTFTALIYDIEFPEYCPYAI